MQAVRFSDVATIRIKNLRLRTFIGIKQEEIDNQQDVIINATIRYHAARAIDDNQIAQALNYRTITKEIIRKVDGQRFALLERLTQELLELIMIHPEVIEANVEVDKPQALRYSDSVSITLSACREP